MASDHQLTRAPPRAVTPKQALSRATGLVSEITHDAKEIVDGYLELAKHDLREEIAHAKSSLTLSVVGAMIVAAAAGLFLVGVCLALAFWLGIRPFWTFGGVGLAGLIAGAIVAAFAVKRAREVHRPPVIEEAKEDVKWITEQT